MNYITCIVRSISEKASNNHNDCFSIADLDELATELMFARENVLDAIDKRRAFERQCGRRA